MTAHNAKDVTVIEAFGQNEQPFECALCANQRTYYDLLSDNRMICVECSVLGNFPQDTHVAVHSRSPDLMLHDPELIGVRNRLVARELEQSQIKLNDLYIPREVAVRLVEICDAQGVSLDVLATVAFRMLIGAYDAAPTSSLETTPALPEELLVTP